MKKQLKILIATPDLDLKRQLTFLVGKLGAVVTPATSGPEALRLAESLMPELIVLDSPLQGQDANAVVRRLRAIAPFLDTPIVVLAERPEGRYQAFQAGATDAMGKPLDALEFQYRLRVHLRSRLRALETADQVQAGALSLEPTTYSASLRGQTVTLTPSEFAIISFLAARPDRTVSTQELLVDALGEPRELGNPQVVHTHIKNLRRKLEQAPAEPRLILSSRRGYTFRAPEA